MNPLIFSAFSIKCSMLQTDQLQSEPRATFLHVYWINIHADHTVFERDKHSQIQLLLNSSELLMNFHRCLRYQHGTIAELLEFNFSLANYVLHHVN
jgi:hypothetical protein